MNRTVFFLSDSTGMTAENLGKSLFEQFPEVRFDTITRPFIDTPEAAQKVAEEINTAAQSLLLRPIVINTIVSRKVNDIIKQVNCYYIDVFSTFLDPLEKELGMKPAYTVGHHSIFEEKGHAVDEAYMQRIESVHFALANDDGMHIHRYDQADIILVGVSRTGKTPTSIYLGLQFGIKAANYPLIPDDLELNTIPPALKKYKHKLFGLTILASRLSEIRNERKPNSTYASLRNCVNEIRAAETLYRQYKIPFLDTTQLSIEEISARMLQQAGIERRVAGG